MLAVPALRCSCCALLPGDRRTRSEVDLGSPSRAHQCRERFDADLGTLVGSVDHRRLSAPHAEVDANVRDIVRRGTEKHQVSRLQRRPTREKRPGVVLGLRGTWDLDAGGGVGSIGQAGAVESGVAVAAPDLRLADLRAGELDCRQRHTTEMIDSGLNGRLNPCGFPPRRYPAGGVG